MALSLIWLPSVLTTAGLNVELVEGWENRGVPDANGRPRDVGAIAGVLCHHTAGPRQGNMPSLNLLKTGRPDLSGPLSQLGLGRDGTYFVIAAGRCNHAGEGNWQGITAGNTNFIGIEAENTGLANDFPWPGPQMNAYARGVAAILKHIGRGPAFCAGHKEYALPRGRKPDPSFEMEAFRTSVAAFMSGSAPPPTPPPDGNAIRPVLRRGAFGDPVRFLQRKLKINVDGDFGFKTEAAVQAFQRNAGLEPDGVVGPRTWAAIDRVG